MEAPALGLQPGCDAGGLSDDNQRGDVCRSVGQAEPHHARQTATGEHANVSQAQVERAQARGLDRIGGRLRDGLFDVAEESDSEVQAVGRRPAKLRRYRCARGAKYIELLPLRLRQRQPKKRPDLYARFDQCEGAQAPGALGRQPN